MKHHHIVIIAGRINDPFYPTSFPACPKHFINVKSLYYDNPIQQHLPT